MMAVDHGLHLANQARLREVYLARDRRPRGATIGILIAHPGMVTPTPLPQFERSARPAACAGPLQAASSSGTLSAFRLRRAREAGAFALRRSEWNQTAHRRHGRRSVIPRRRCAVPLYVILANWTDQGARSAKDSPRRLDAAKKALKDMGGEFKSFYLTMGDYDIVAVYEAPDDAVAARFNLQLGMLGNIRTRTLKAFPEAAYREIIASLG
jgi:uncharacterized protein with GYD domain